MRILIWSQYFWPENFRINELAVALEQAGAEVAVLTGKPNYPGGKIFDGYRAGGLQRERFGSRMEVARIPILPRGAKKGIRLLFNYLSFIVSGYLFGPAMLRGRKYDAMLVYAPSPLLQALPALHAARRMKIPLALWVQDLWPDALRATGTVTNPWLLKMVEIPVRFIYRRADAILIQSEAFRNPVEQLGGDKRKIAYFPNGAPLPADSADAREKCAIAEEVGKHFSIVFAGNIGSAQSCETIVEAAALLRHREDIRIFLVGGGSRAAAIAHLIQEKGLGNVVTTGHLAPERMTQIFASASALLICLARDPALTATVPSKLQSYLAAGKPVIACLDGEAARIVAQAGAGLCCEGENPEALAAAIERFHSMTQEERRALGENARACFLANFEIGASASHLIRHLENLARPEAPAES